MAGITPEFELPVAGSTLTREQSGYLIGKLFRPGPPQELKVLSGDFFDVGMVRRLLVALNQCSAEASDDDVIRRYVDTAATNLVTPNPLFDEAWYRSCYADIATAVSGGAFVSGFAHFVSYGIHEGRWPSFAMKACANGEPAPAVSTIDAAVYRKLNAGARAFLDAFDWIGELEHYNSYGRHLNYAIRMDRRRSAYPTPAGAAVSEIDVEYYRERYLADQPERDPVEHYLQVGAVRGYSPTRWFDEEWYRAFYPDVRKAISHGDIVSGFQHFVLHGRAEGRRASFDLGYALETRIPGVTAPALLARVPHLRDRLAAPPAAAVRVRPNGGTAARIWFLLPFLNVDIAFGGYAAVFALMAAVRRDGFAVGIISTEEEQPNLDYFLWRQKDPALREVVRESALFGRAQLDALPIRHGDLVLSYSIWDLRLASRLAAAAGPAAPFLLTQEYEPVFFDNGSMRAACASQYAIEHVPIINSQFLLRFLRMHEIGAFAPARRRGRPATFHVFEHRINRLGGQDATAMRARRERVLVAYARPEAHAARNLFELVVLALERACEDGLFGPEWSFVGLGALSELPDVVLPHGRRMKLVPKMSEAEYVAFMGAVDIGISLMSAPHPSVVPFELATTGALVVTNTYENRSADDLLGVCGNIVPCAESLDGIVGALKRALEQVEEFELRDRRTFRPAERNWDAIFSPAFIRDVFGAPAAPGRDAADSAATIRRLLPRTRHLDADAAAAAHETGTAPRERGNTTRISFNKREEILG